MRRGGPMTAEESARRMTALLASAPRSMSARRLVSSLPKREKVIVGADEYEVFGSAERHIDWHEHGKPAAPSTPPPSKAKARMRRRDRGKAPGEIPTLVEQLIEIQLHTCIICGEGLYFERYENIQHPLRQSIDHVHARVNGGDDHGNRLAAHRFCNSRKGNRRPTGCELIWLAVVNARLGIAA